MIEWRDKGPSRFADYPPTELLYTGGVGRVFAKVERGHLFLTGPFPYA
jgi:hypothetical protein